MSPIRRPPAGVWPAPILPRQSRGVLLGGPQKDARRGIAARATDVLEPGFVVLAHPGHNLGVAGSEVLLLVRVLRHVEEQQRGGSRGAGVGAEGLRELVALGAG